MRNYFILSNENPPIIGSASVSLPAPATESTCYAMEN
jgi:hypothetical protein